MKHAAPTHVFRLRLQTVLANSRFLPSHIYVLSTLQAGCTRSHEQCGMAEPHAALADAPAAVRLWDETHAALSPWLEA